MTRSSALTVITMLAVATPAILGITRHDTSATEQAPAPTAPTITYADPPTSDRRELVEWAIERYLAVGLQLPDVTIRFPVTCGGKAGRYLVGQHVLELCRPTRKLVLHEFAHAWDDTADVDREAFFEVRGVDHWYEADDSEGGPISGGEQLARVMTWGLMHVDLTASSSEYRGQPVDEQPRSLPGLDDSSPEVLTQLFVMLTGRAPLSPGRVAADRTTPEEPTGP